MENNIRQTRRKFTAKFKATVVIEVLKEPESLNELATWYEVYPNQISQWKREFLTNVERAFEFNDEKKDEESVQVSTLFEQMDQLKLEKNFFKRELNEGWTVNERRCHMDSELSAQYSMAGRSIVDPLLWLVLKAGRRVRAATEFEEADRHLLRPHETGLHVPDAYY